MIALSERELEVLKLYARGRSYKAIAAELGISVDTVKTYAQRIIVKSAAECLRQAAWLRRKET